MNAKIMVVLIATVFIAFVAVSFGTSAALIAGIAFNLGYLYGMVDHA